MNRAAQLQLTPTATTAVSAPKWLPVASMEESPWEVLSPSPQHLISSEELSLSSCEWNMAWGIPAPSFPAKTGPLQSSLYLPLPVVVQEAHSEAPATAEHCQKSSVCDEARASLIPNSLDLGSSLDKCEYAYSWRKLKEPNKALSNWPWELLRFGLIGAQSFALLSAGSIPCICPSPSVSPQSDEAQRISPIRLVSKTSKMSDSLDSPHPRAAPMPPIEVPAHSLQALSIQSTVKIVPWQQDTKNVVSTSHKSRDTQHSQLLEEDKIKLSAGTSRTVDSPHLVNNIPL